MVIVISRQTQYIRPGKWDELEELDKKCNIVEKRLGFPDTKKRYRLLVGSRRAGALIVEYTWESLAKME
jgi:hypothetical protein